MDCRIIASAKKTHALVMERIEDAIHIKHNILSKLYPCHFKETCVYLDDGEEWDEEHQTMPGGN